MILVHKVSVRVGMTTNPCIKFRRGQAVVVQARSNAGAAESPSVAPLCGYGIRAVA